MNTTIPQTTEEKISFLKKRISLSKKVIDENTKTRLLHTNSDIINDYVIEEETALVKKSEAELAELLTAQRDEREYHFQRRNEIRGSTGSLYADDEELI